MAYIYGNTAGPGPSYYRAAIDQAWSDLGNGYYRCCANIRVQVTAGDFWGTYIQTSWGKNQNIYGPGDYCFLELGCKEVPYGGSWTVSGSAWYNNHKSSVSHTFKPPIPTYTVSYNANGGSGAPKAQEKVWGKTLTLSSARPTRTGYTFQGWATSAAGEVVYAPGASYTGNAAITLYAVWKINTYTVSYNANGGSGAPKAQEKVWGTDLTLSKTIPIRSGFKFLGWGTSSTDITPDYQPGETYSTNTAITLYAIWKRKGQMHIVQNDQIKKGRALLKNNGAWKAGVPWKKVDGTWKRGGV